MQTSNRPSQNTTTDPLVSVIVPTKNSGEFLERCLSSIRSQTYKNIELIVVDNFSTDDTQTIAKRFTDKVLVLGPERSAQRNFGVQQSSGVFVAIIDSDMELAPAVIQDCVAKAESDAKIIGIIIPEESFGVGFWSQCKKLERSFYVGVEWMEAARFFKKETYLGVGGYNVELISGEDWDLSQRVAGKGKLDRISSFIRHNEGRISLVKTIKKKYYYAKHFSKYISQNKNSKALQNQTGVLTRYKLFLAKPKQLFSNPLVGFGMLFMKTCELGIGAVGYTNAKLYESA